MGPTWHSDRPPLGCNNNNNNNIFNNKIISHINSNTTDKKCTTLIDTVNLKLPTYSGMLPEGGMLSPPYGHRGGPESHGRAGNR